MSGRTFLLLLLASINWNIKSEFKRLLFSLNILLIWFWGSYNIGDIFKLFLFLFILFFVLNNSFEFLIWVFLILLLLIFKSSNNILLSFSWLLLLLLMLLLIFVFIELYETLLEKV